MKNIKIEFKWALYLAISFLLWMLIEKLTGLHDEHIDKHYFVTMLYFFVSVAMYVFALLDKRKNFYGGYMSYKQSFMAGFIMAIFVTVLSPPCQYIISYIITPDYFSNVIEYSLESGYFKTLEEAQAQFNFKNYVIQSTISSLISGVVITAIASVFIKKKDKA